MADAINEFTLLCESCGYPLTGLPAAGLCPECGKPIAGSRPERRGGSAWQQRPTVSGWISTNVAVLRSPTAVFDAARVERRRSDGLLAINLVAAAVLPIGIVSAAEEELSGFVLIVLTCLGLWVLTMIEYIGIQFFGRRARRRITPTIAAMICAHASVGWLLGGLLAFATIIVGAAWQLLVDPGLWIPASLLRSACLLDLFCGMLVFETLVYIGIRRCRFANRPAPDVGGA